MLRCDEGDRDDDDEVFFDTADCLSPPDSNNVLFEYEVWVNQPQSVKERRRRFLEGIMGLSDQSVSNVSENLILPGSSEEAHHMFDEMPECSKDEVSVNFHHEGEDAQEEEDGDFSDVGIKKKKKERRNWWWKRFVNKTRSKKSHRRRRIKVKQNRKRWIEFSGVYNGQEIRAHNGIIWTMKFSPNGKYLASGGEDGVVRIWCVVLQDTSEEDNLVNEVKQDMFCSWKKKHSSQIPIVLPNKVFRIEESPLHEFYGHTSDVLDLAWSNSDILLSSSMDKTVRMWKIGCNQCLRVFHHNDYVTCIQVNPVDDNYFISGSIDGKVRIWGLYEERVVDWADIHDVITAISYQPDGKGFLVGSLSGTCRFYVASGKHFQLEAQIRVDGKKRSGGNKITSIQFSQEKHHQRVLITSEDSKLRLLEGVDVVNKYRGLPKSGSQMCGSFTSDGSHMISVGQDSRVYIWNAAVRDDSEENLSPKHTKSNRSCEYFFSEGVTVALPWSGMSTQHQMAFGFAHSCSEMQHQMAKDSVRANWFSIDGTCSRGSMTWPEEKLPSWDHSDEYFEHNLCPKDPWGLSLVTASSDGTIRTFHNFGLPVRL